jgi:ParB family chromosome partitioning protein
MKKATIKEVRDIPLGDLVIGKGQVRVKDVGKEIDELADSIQIMGLLEPIVVAPADKAGKYEILTGQRRFLAHKQLKLPTISAAVLSQKVDEGTAKAISVTENLVRRDISQKEKIDACTSLYKKYGSITAVKEATGLSVGTIGQYVKYDRLVPQLKKLVDSGTVDIKAAIRAQDAASVSGEVDEKDAVKFAKEMSGMSGAQQRKIVSERQSDPEASVDDVIEGAKTGSKITQIVVTLTAEIHRRLQSFAQSESQSQDDAAATLIEDSLKDKGF